MHDVLIIGAGPAGLAAAFWCDQLGLDVLVIEQQPDYGGQLHSIYGAIENYPGLHATNGEEFLKSFAAGTAEAGFDLWTNVEIATVNLAAKRVALKSGEDLSAITIVLATGVRRRQLGIPGEAEFAGKGIIESGARDKALYAGKDVCIIGGGDAAIENALLLAEVCATVTVVNRSRKLRARREFTEQLGTNHCVTVFNEAIATRILGSSEVEAVEIQRKQALKPFQMAVRGVFIRVGVTPNSDLFSDQLEVDDDGYIAVTSQQETSVTNVFAIGDVSSPLAPTISGAAGDGATAAKVIAARLHARS
ncbi:MAG: NAD(P)/FAD-dependent oxidoreductase [Acidobacteriota bacterium]|nr:NAD(P)/FAD-dependent oxidoreductase [Acidobacteriota bacterium]